MRNYQRYGEQERSQEHDRLCGNALGRKKWIAAACMVSSEGGTIADRYHGLREAKWKISAEVEALVGRGFADVLIKLLGADGSVKNHIVVECKTWEDKWCAGDVIRQLKLYRRSLGVAEDSVEMVLYVPEQEEHSKVNRLPDVSQKLLVSAGVVVLEDFAWARPGPFSEIEREPEAIEELKASVSEAAQ